MKNNNLTSSLIASQLPEHIRDDPSYDKFVLFLQAYYEWMELEGNTSNISKNLLNYIDVDKSSDDFLQYYYNDFLSYFPQDILADKTQVTKLAKELYSAKGTPASYQLLFRILYNTDVDFFYTKDAVLKASDGKWYVSKSLKLASDDVNLLSINNLRIFGETSKSIATIENSVLAGSKTEVFISNIERLFQSGEYVRIVDSNNRDVLFNNKVLRAKIIGQINQIKINPKYRGFYYKPGDPIIIYGGLNTISSPAAKAEVGTTTSGSIQRIKVEAGGYGYTPSKANNIVGGANSHISIAYADGAAASIGGLNVSDAFSAKVSLIPIDFIGYNHFITIGNTSYAFANNINANVTTSLANAFTYTSFTTYPISSIIVDNGGGGVTQSPAIIAESLYNLQDNQAQGNLKNIGILAPIKILSGGQNYVNNDIIVISGGSGYGAYANVTNVSSNGSILKISYVYKTNEFPINYPLGGMGFRSDALPSVSITSITGANASIIVPGILGDGAIFTPSTDRIGSITTIKITDFGEDYLSAPTISLKVQDIVVKGLHLASLPERGDNIYQGISLNDSTYAATVDSITLLIPNADELKTLFNLRVFNYSAKPVYNSPLLIDSKPSINMNMTTDYNIQYPNSKYINGLISYGDGTAKANATFLNGLTIGEGQYLDSAGQLSSFDVLQSADYNNYTYKITIEKEISKYRKTLLDLLHPSGMKVIGRYPLKSNVSTSFSGFNLLNSGIKLSHFTGNLTSNIVVSSDFTNYSNNIIQFNNLFGANLQSFLAPNNIIKMTTQQGDLVTSKILSVNNISNTAIMSDSLWLTFANVANITANASSNIIHISALTNSYDIINNGNYSNKAYPLMDIVRTGDKILVANNSTKTVSNIDYVHNIIYVDVNLTNSVNSLMTVNRTMTSLAGNVVIYNVQ